MYVLNANYGRLSSDICVPPGVISYPDNATDCRAPNTTEILQGQCDGTFSCEFNALTSVFGHDPCPHIHKYLHVLIQCIQPGKYHRVLRLFPQP